MSSLLDSVQNDELADELAAINAIYGPDTVTINSSRSATVATSTLDLGSPGSSTNTAVTTTVTVQIPDHPHLSFLIGFDDTYPETPPRIIGTASTASRGEGKIAVDVLEDIVRRTHQPGSVCLFEVISEAAEAFEELNIGGSSNNKDDDEGAEEEEGGKVTTGALTDSFDATIENFATLSLRETFGLDSPPDWILSDVVAEKKSVFVGRAAHVTSLDQAQAFIDHLLATEKKVAAATHNISAWRIRQKKPGGGPAGINGKGESPGEAIFQDCDDDGETAAGGRLLHLMQLMDVWDVVLVVTRWYGGIKLGPDRFRIINAVGRDALIKGGFTKEESTGGDKGKKKGKK